MNASDGFLAQQQPQAAHQLLGKKLGDITRHAEDEKVDNPTQNLGTHRADALVNGHDAAGMGGLVLALLEELVVRTLDLGQQPDPRLLERAVDQNAAAGRQRVFEIFLVEPDGLELSRLIFRDDFDDFEVPAPGLAHVNRLHLDFDGGALPGLNLADFQPAAPVFVTERQVEQQIVDRVDADFGERRGLFGADALDELDGGVSVEHNRVLPRKCYLFARWSTTAVPGSKRMLSRS